MAQFTVLQIISHEFVRQLDLTPSGRFDLLPSLFIIDYFRVPIQLAGLILLQLLPSLAADWSGPFTGHL